MRTEDERTAVNTGLKQTGPEDHFLSRHLLGPAERLQEGERGGVFD